MTAIAHPAAAPHCKRATGRFYTRGNPFTSPAFQSWAARAGLPNACILEPFAGAGHIIRALQAVNLCKKFAAFDIAPGDAKVQRADTIAEFPTAYSVCITNPPWLARNSATRRKLNYPQTRRDNLYKHCLGLCLQHCDYVAALLPASFLQCARRFDRDLRARLSDYILLHAALFNDTENPVCLALFEPNLTSRVAVHYDDKFIGALHDLEKYMPTPSGNRRIKFNDANGQLGFVSFDNTRAPSIKFCAAAELSGYTIKESSRFITRISGEFAADARFVKKLNQTVQLHRRNTLDLFLTPFKGLRADGNYRRRMEFAMAKKFINVN